jgi:hypothetical protein
LKRQQLIHFSGFLAVVLLSVGICFRFYGDILHNPGGYLFGAEGDGLKNYFTVAFQAVHGNGWDFKGMLYPFGDHLFFADGQPLLTSCLQWFNLSVEQGYVVIAALNLLMIGSLVVCAALVYLILKRCLISTWFAIPFAILIAFLSPQIARFAGHYALSYTFFIPLIWYLLIRLEAGTPWVWAVVFAVVVMIFSFIQPYYLLMASAFLGAVILWDGISFLIRKRKLIAPLPKIIALVVPFVGFTIYMHFADIVADRPAAPYGLFGYVASFQSVFVPVMEPFRSLFTSYFFRLFVPAHWEGYAYVGFVPAICGAAALGVILLKKRWKDILFPVLPRAVQSFLVPACIVLLFSMAVFHYLGLSWLGTNISAIGQFRSLGRMAWVFYYVFSVWSVVYLYRGFRVLRSRSNGNLRYHAVLMVFLALGWWSLDAIVNIKAVKKQMISNPNGKEIFGSNFRDLLNAQGINSNDFQAIIPLPFELVGSEKLELNPGSKATAIAMQAAFSTGIPLMNGVMSRTSLGVTEQLAQVVSNPLFPHKILEHLPNNRDLLVLVAHGTLSDGERFLVDNSKLIYSTSSYRLLSLSLENFNQALVKAKAIAVKDSLAIEKPFFQASEIMVHEDELLMDEKLATGDYVFSFWLKIDPQTTSLPILEWTEGETDIYSKRCGSSAEMSDGWLLISQPFKAVAGRVQQFRFRQGGEMVCRVILRPADQNVWSIDGYKRYFNNIALNEP